MENSEIVWDADMENSKNASDAGIGDSGEPDLEQMVIPDKTGVFRIKTRILTITKEKI